MTLIVVPVVATPTAAPIVKNALSIELPLFESFPSFATYITFGAELMPAALSLVSPILIDGLFPSRVIDALPIVRIPIILASPSTNRAVLPTPTVTVPIPFVAPRVVIPET